MIWKLVCACKILYNMYSMYVDIIVNGIVYVLYNMIKMKWLLRKYEDYDFIATRQIVSAMKVL